MSDLRDLLDDGLRERLAREGHELVDLVSVPSGSDRLVRFRTIQEVLSEFDTSDAAAEGQTYVMRIRKRREEQEQAAKAESQDSIYLANGRLNADFLVENAKILFLAGDFAAARQIWTTLAKSGERTSEARLGIARCLECEGRADEALKAYDDLVLYHPSLEAYQRYGALLIRSGKDQQAAETLERALVLRDLPSKSRYDLHKAAGNSWLRAGVPAKAERNYRKALEANPLSDAVAANLGALCLQQGRHDEASVAFAEALRVNPRNERAWFGAGSVALALGNKREAHDAFATSLRIRIQQPQAIFHLVKCAYEIREYGTARDLLRAYVDVSPFNANLLYSLAGLEYHLGDSTQAARTARMILQIQPEHAEAKALLERLGRF
jgi:Tfp pilus assembly protein PilF